MTDATPAPTATRIRDAAAELFSEHGYHATSMRAVAAACGIRAASVYGHFAAKEDILFAITSETMVEMLEGAREALSDASSPPQALRDLVHFHVRYSAEHRVRAKVADDELDALSPQRRLEVLRIRDAYEALFRSVLRRGRDDCGWTVPDLAVVTFALTTMASSVDVWYRDGGRLTAERIASIYGDLALRAVGADPVSPPLAATAVRAMRRSTSPS